MAQYYYLLSSLPFLRYEDSSAPVSMEQFYEYCQDHCSSKVFELVNQASWDYPLWHTDGSTVLHRYWLWEGALQNELALLRGQTLGVNVADTLAEVPDLPEVRQIAVEAVKQDSPLEAENYLNRARWDFLSQEKVGHYFDLDALLIYCIQLQLLERRLGFDSEKGFARYKEIYDDILQNVDTTIFPGVTE